MKPARRRSGPARLRNRPARSTTAPVSIRYPQVPIHTTSSTRDLPTTRWSWTPSVALRGSAARRGRERALGGGRARVYVRAARWRRSPAPRWQVAPPGAGAHLAARHRPCSPANVMQLIPTRVGRVAVNIVGDGPPLVLLHSVAHDHHDFDAIVPTLSTQFRTIAVDWPGHGESDMFDPPSSAGAL